MKKPHNLQVMASAPDEDVVRALKELLDLAEKGEITALAAAGLMPGGDVYLTQVVGSNQYAIVGVLEELKLSILNRPDTDEIGDLFGV